MPVDRQGNYIHKLMPRLRKDMPLRLVVGSPSYAYLKQYENSRSVEIIGINSHEWDQVVASGLADYCHAFTGRQHEFPILCLWTLPQRPVPFRLARGRRLWPFRLRHRYPGERDQAITVVFYPARHACR